MTTLLGLPYSPWSEKARWALEARRIPHTYRTYAPWIGEPALRIRMRKWSGAITVPVLLLDDGTSIGDSTAIARWADERGEGESLFPKEHDAEIRRFIALSERALEATRALALYRMRDDEEALADLAPKPLRKRFRGLAVRIARGGVNRTINKYGAHASDPSTHERTIVESLEQLRSTLKGTKGPIFGAFSFADIAMTQLVVPAEPPRVGLRFRDASRRAFTQPGLRERYLDLVEWRDAIYDAHRPRG